MNGAGKIGQTAKMAAKTINVPNITFGINQKLEVLDNGWLAFPGHYLLYASAGTFTLEVEERQWTLPPDRAAWVIADRPIHLYAKAPITSSSILFAKDSIPPLPFDSRVFAVTPLAREMIMYATRWGIDRDPHDVTADQFFAATAGVCIELATKPEHFWLPRVQSQDLAIATDYILAHLDTPLTIARLAEIVHVSERTLARRFVEEAHLTCGQFIWRARMLRAMELLSNPTMPITDIAFAVGFDSISAFNHRFRRFTQETPSHYRKHLMPR